MNESEIRDLLGAGIGEEPPVVGGPAAVFAGVRMQTARRRMVRNRAVVGVLSAVAVLGVAAGVVVAGGRSGTSAPSVSPGVRGGAVPPAPTAQTTMLGPVTVGLGQALLDGTSAVELLKAVLPKGLKTGDYSGADNNAQAMDGAVVGRMSVDDGSGKPTQVTVSVGWHQREAASDLACKDVDHVNSGLVDCQAHVEQDGSVVLTYRVDDNHTGTDGRPVAAYELVAERLFPNGVKVLVAAANWFAPPNNPFSKVGPTRPAPLLSGDELVTMAMDSNWGPTVPAAFAEQAKRDVVPYQDDAQRQ